MIQVVYNSTGKKILEENGIPVLAGQTVSEPAQPVVESQPVPIQAQANTPVPSSSLQSKLGVLPVTDTGVSPRTTITPTQDAILPSGQYQEFTPAVTATNPNQGVATRKIMRLSAPSSLFSLGNTGTTPTKRRVVRGISPFSLSGNYDLQEAIALRRAGYY